MKFRQFHKISGIRSAAEGRNSIEYPPPPFKEYLRFPRIALPGPCIPEEPLSTVFAKRESKRIMSEHAVIGNADIATILHGGAGINAERARDPARKPASETIGQFTVTAPSAPRFHPSGGSFYPLEYYLAAFRVESLDVGVYHYAPRDHSLEKIPFALPRVFIDACKEYVPVTHPAAVLLMTSMWGRNYLKYGEFAYRLSLLEAGHSGQDMLLLAAGLGVKAYVAAAFDDAMLAETLDIAKDDEDPLYLVFLGH